MKNHRSKLKELGACVRLFDSDLSKTVKFCDMCKERYKWQLCKVRMFNSMIFMVVLWAFALVVLGLLEEDPQCAPGYMYDDELGKCVPIENVN